MWLVPECEQPCPGERERDRAQGRGRGDGCGVEVGYNVLKIGCRAEKYMDATGENTGKFGIVCCFHVRVYRTLNIQKDAMV